MRHHDEGGKSAEKILDAMGNLSDEAYQTRDGDLIEPAPQGAAQKKKPRIMRYLAGLAAAYALFFVVTQLVLPFVRGNGASKGSGSQAMEDGSSQFMSYKGPLLPLMTGPGEKAEDLRAERQIDFDFYLLEEKKGEAKNHPRSVLVKDSYSIENKGGQRKIQFLYPFVSSVDQLFFTAPRVIKDGEEIESRLYYGDYTGGFAPASGSESEREGESINLREIRNWEDLQDLLSSGAYLEKARDQGPDLSQVPAIVYEFKESYYPEDQADAPNPSLVAGFEIDEEATRVLNVGFDGFLRSGEGKVYYEYSIPKNNGAGKADDHHYLILIGGDTRSLTLKGQTTGGFDAYEEGADGSCLELEGAGATVERLEMSLDQALDLALTSRYKSYQGYAEEMVSTYQEWQGVTRTPADKITISYEDFKALYIKDLFQFGLLGENPKTRYQWGALEHMDTTNAPRVLYSAFEVELEAGERVDLTFETYKEGSMDFHGVASKKGDFDHNNMLYGYDLLQGIGNALDLESSRAEIIDYGGVKIIRQNFGFDLEKGIKSVSLSQDIPHYYMEVKEK